MVDMHNFHLMQRLLWSRSMTTIGSQFSLLKRSSSCVKNLTSISFLFSTERKWGLYVDVPCINLVLLTAHALIFREYYFSPDNLQRDFFLRKNVSDCGTCDPEVVLFDGTRDDDVHVICLETTSCRVWKRCLLLAAFFIWSFTSYQLHTGLSKAGLPFLVSDPFSLQLFLSHPLLL